MKHPARTLLGVSLSVVSSFVLIGCGSSPTQPSAGGIAGSTVTTRADVLVDASKDGGVWWFPQSGTFDAKAAHQGKALADVLRGKDYTVDELPRGAAVTSSILGSYRLVIRAGACASYTSAELAAYDQLLARSATLVLLTDHMNGGCSTTDPLALRYGGITFAGAESGTVTSFVPHPLTAGVTQFPYMVGATVVSWNAGTVQILGFLAPGKPVMGVITGHAAKVFFLGEMNGIESVPQPFVDNLVAWAFGS